MGFKKDAPVAVAETPETPAVVLGGVTNEPTAPKQEPCMSSEERKVRGQVRMHAAVAGYKVAAQLAPTLANTASGIKDELHKLAAEVAAKIEEYSFL